MTKPLSNHQHGKLYLAVLFSDPDSSSFEVDHNLQSEHTRQFQEEELSIGCPWLENWFISKLSINSSRFYCRWISLPHLVPVLSVKKTNRVAKFSRTTKLSPVHRNNRRHMEEKEDECNNRFHRIVVLNHILIKFLLKSSKTHEVAYNVLFKLKVSF